MKCPKCQFENRPEIKFCEECGARVSLACPRCGLEVPLGAKFCGACGTALPRAPGKAEGFGPAIVGERRQITVLFSDLSGYTSMTEKLDPETVREIMARIFDEITGKAKKYDGFIGRFLGDAAMVLFGIPTSHEDDAVRAIRTAREIHSAVETMSPVHRAKTGVSLAMHSGINTGLVVLADKDFEKTAGDITGDAVNVASRLCSLAKAGTILVGPETQLLAEAFFSFQRLEPVAVKGRLGLVQPYQVISPVEKPEKKRRLHGLRAELVGRASEMALLAVAAERLQQGERTIVAIRGDPGTGKTRLVDEFRATLDRRRFQWVNAYAYGYTQNIPYWPLVDLFNRLWSIDEGDSPERVRDKIAAGVEGLLGRAARAVPMIGSLYALPSSKLENMSPELWKVQLFEAVKDLLATFAGARPTVICLEDLHWADPPSVDLLRYLFSASSFPALFLCVYRPPFQLFSAEPVSIAGESYREIQLQDFSPSEAHDMMEALLGTKRIPPELTHFVEERVEGNPFYLEEVLNSLIESDILVQDDGAWKLTKPLKEIHVSPTIQGVIVARLDRLSLEMKRVLQEASVIGRHFPYVIIRHITELEDYLQDCLGGLEGLDLIRTNAVQPEIEYIFKHALTQEVVYNGLLKKERQAVHERIGQVMEEVFRDRLPEMVETLAFHFKQGRSLHKAVAYLVKSGEKNLRRYAVEESHQYFREAYELLTRSGDADEANESLLVDVLIKWAFVHYYAGEYRKLQELLERHLDLAEKVANPNQLGMYYAWLSCALWHREMVREAYEYLTRSLGLGEETGDRQVMGYAYTWLTWTCIELGRLAEAAGHAAKAQELCRADDMDHYIYFNSLAGQAYALAHMGQKRKAQEGGKTLVEFGRRHSNVRSMVMGYTFIGFSHMVGGDIQAATSSFEEAIRVSADPWYSQFPKLALCYVRIAHGDFRGLEEILGEIIAFSEQRGAEYTGTPSKMLLGATLAAQGRLSRGMKLIEEVSESWLQTGNRFRYAMGQMIAGSIYALMAQGGGRKSLSGILRNLWFLIKNAPFADRRAITTLGTTIEIAAEMGAKFTIGRASLTLGLLHKAKGRREQARECLLTAVQVFEECEADIYLKMAEGALEGFPSNTA